MNFVVMCNDNKSLCSFLDPCRWKVVDHYVSRVCSTMQLLQQQDIIGRTSELARVLDRKSVV